MSEQASGDGANAPTRPLWYEDAPSPSYTSGPVERAGVCVVGAGIAGLTTAYLLANEGREVVVVDERPVGQGQTGRTSAHLSSVLDDRFAHLESVHGLETTRIHYESHATAIDRIERIAREEGIDCDFARIDGMLFPGSVDESELEKEFEAAQRVGVQGVEHARAAPSRGGVERACLRFPNQARFHPLRYLSGLTEALARKGVRFRIGERVEKLSGDGPVEARLVDGSVIAADHAVAATNVPAPINWTGVYTKMAPYRTYIVAVEMPHGAFHDALWWDMEDPYHYVRLHRTGGREVLIVGGADHKTGQSPEGGESSAFRRLESWARATFPESGAVVARWSGQVSEPADGIAFIGRAPTRGDGACYLITGDSGMGLTHGTLGAMLVTDLILGRDNPWAEVYDPSRKPLRSPGEFLTENLNAASMFKDYLTPGEVDSADEVRPGTGAIVRDGAKKLAVYRSPDGVLHTRSAVCPHMKCVVRWNEVESSWDCPCHGSRFDCQGRVLIGPAVHDLDEA